MPPVLPAGCFRQEVKNMNFMTNVLQSWDMMTICTKHGFDILIISGSYGGHI